MTPEALEEVCVRTWCSWAARTWSGRPCWLRGGHLWEMRWTENRLWMQCLQCPRETPGWVLTSIATPREIA